ncbi:MAG: lamin tail domain-containing protein [Verrucomicrobiota bacterium]
MCAEYRRKSEEFGNPAILQTGPGSGRRWLAGLVGLLWAPLLPADMVINEIHYDPADKTQAIEFIELTNTGAVEVDLSGWRMTGGIDYQFADGVVIGAGDFQVIVQDETDFNRTLGSIFQGGSPADGEWSSGKLTNDGDRVRLRDASNAIVDEVTYQGHFPWPSAARGGGVSMELIHPSLDNDLAGHWRSSAGKPTPGKANSVLSETVPPAIRQVTHTPSEPKSSDPVTISAKITDGEGVGSVSLHYQVVEPGAYLRLTDAEYETRWESILMFDDGSGGDVMANDAVFSAQLPAEVVAHRNLIRYRIEAEDAAGSGIRVPYADDEQPNFALFVYDGVPGWRGRREPGGAVREFTPDELNVLPTYHLIAKEDDVERSQYVSAAEGNRFPGTMVYNGEVFDHLEFANRGEFSTYVSGKNKWRFYFRTGHDFPVRDNYGRRYGRRVRILNFNACASPWVPANRGMSGLDEALAYRLYGLAGAPSSRTHFVHFRIVDAAEEAPSGDQYGGDLWGLYLSVEHTDGRFLDDRNLPDGNTYKIEGGNGDKRNQGSTQTAGSDDWSSFRSGYGRSQTEEWWRANLDLPSYFAFRASHRAVGNIDIRDGWNCAFYHHPDGRWHSMPWDLDMVFMPETHWAGEINVKNCLQVDAIDGEFRGRCRELLDLLYSDQSGTGGQVAQAVDELAQWVGASLSWAEAVNVEKISSTRAEVTGASPHGFTTGEKVHVAGADQSQYNGFHEITVTGPSSFTFGVSLFAPQDITGVVRFARPTEGGSAWSEIDAAMWNHHPRTAGNHKGQFFVTPKNQNFRGGTLVRTLTSPDVGGYIDYLKGYTTDTDPDGWEIGDGDQRGYGYNYLAFEGEDSKAPNRPVISYTGPEGFPVDALEFSTSDFSGGSIFSPQSFVGMKWRVAEISNPGLPGYEEGTPWKYEIDALWESPVETVFSEQFAFPSTLLAEGRTYRVRVRYLNNQDRWSHWSEPVTFQGGAPDLSPFEGQLAISEIMFHPSEATEEEKAAGFSTEDFEYLELQNIGDAVVPLDELRLTKGVDYDFSSSEKTSLAAGEVFLLAKNREAFAFRYGADPGADGEYGGANLANGGERLKLSFGAGAGLIDFEYNDESPWPVSPDGEGYSLVLVNPAAPGEPASWEASEEIGGTPGQPEELEGGVVVKPGGGYAAWIESVFLPEQQRDEVVSGKLADPDRDGLANLLEYALGTDALSRDGGALFSVKAGSDPDAFATLSFARLKTAEGVELRVEHSADLVTWGPASLQSTVPIEGVAELERVTYRAEMEEDDQRFFRIVVSLQP